MKSKTIGGVRFKLRRVGNGLRLVISDSTRIPAVLVPAHSDLQLHHLQALEEWLKQAQAEIENG